VASTYGKGVGREFSFVGREITSHRLFTEGGILSGGETTVQSKEKNMQSGDWTSKHKGKQEQSEKEKEEGSSLDCYS